MRTWNPVRALTQLARNAPWIVMAVALHAIMIVTLGIWYVAKERPTRPEESITLRAVAPREVELPPEDIAPVEIVRTKIPDNVEEKLVDTTEPVYVPFQDETTPTEEVGDPNSTALVDTGDSGGNTPAGVGPGRVKGQGVGPFQSRDPGRRRHGTVGGPEGGGRREEALVLHGMQWLARHQLADGSWSAARLHERCQANGGCAPEKAEFHDLYDEGTTALAVLTFLGAGYSHESKQYLVDPVDGKRYRIGEIVKSGLQWLVKRQHENGQFSKDKAFLYNEALATMALAEAYGLSRNKYWKEPAQRGVDFLERAQRPNPSGSGLWGWRYLPRSEVEDQRRSASDGAGSKDLFDSDTSVTTWCVMALKSAELAELTVDRASMEGGYAFVNWVTADNGLVGYIDPKGAGATVTGKNDHFQYHPAVMSALGMCTRAFVRHDASDPVLELSARQVVQDLPTVRSDKLSVDYYYWYYGSLALNQFDGPDSPRKSGKYWGPWNKAMVDALEGLADTTPKSCRNGGWITPDRWAYAGGPVYSTAVAVLTLEVYYRYANAFVGSVRAR